MRHSRMFSRSVPSANLRLSLSVQLGVGDTTSVHAWLQSHGAVLVQLAAEHPGLAEGCLGLMHAWQVQYLRQPCRTVKAFTSTSQLWQARSKDCHG